MPDPTDASWPAPADTPTLPADEVHVWRAVLDPPSVPLDALWPLLDAGERARARRFVFAHHRRRFVAARGALRLLLGRYLGEDPAALTFVYGAHGKPALERPPGAPTLDFNLSHAHTLALLAFTHGRRVGVDVEHIRPDRATEAVATRFFASGEVAAFRTLPDADRVPAFFNAWTRKEAYMKAHGLGITMGLGTFSVTLAPGVPAALVETSWDPSDAARWSMRALHPDPAYAAALAVEGDGWRLRCYSW